MQHLLHEGMDAGLCGFSLQRLGEHSVQADFDGTPMVTDTMADKDILALCEVLAERDEGFIQVTQATGDIKADLAFVEKMAKVAKRPILHNLVFAGPDPKIHTRSLKWLERTNEKGLRIFGQGATLRSGFAFTMADWNLYDASPGLERGHHRHQRREAPEAGGPRDPRTVESGDRRSRGPAGPGERHRRTDPEPDRAGRQPPGQPPVLRR